MSDFRNINFCQSNSGFQTLHIYIYLYLNCISSVPYPTKYPQIWHDMAKQLCGTSIRFFLFVWVSTAIHCTGQCGPTFLFKTTFRHLCQQHLLKSYGCAMASQLFAMALFADKPVTFAFGHPKKRALVRFGHKYCVCVCPLRVFFDDPYTKRRCHLSI